mmetsp:Transcript_63947/g.176605  ORF Transcript_63947/g.176605 Transcript_63947/m.176605 type:complete len:214 (+) Transcript_63947:157-798(+)
MNALGSKMNASAAKTLQPSPNIDQPPHKKLKKGGRANASVKENKKPARPTVNHVPRSSTHPPRRSASPLPTPQPTALPSAQPSPLPTSQPTAVPTHPHSHPSRHHARDCKTAPIKQKANPGGHGTARPKKKPRQSKLPYAPRPKPPNGPPTELQEATAYVLNDMTDQINLIQRDLEATTKKKQAFQALNFEPDSNRAEIVIQFAAALRAAKKK